MSEDSTPQNAENDEKRHIAYQILALLPQIIAKIQAHNFASDAQNGLHWHKKKVDGIERAVWWVTGCKPEQGQDPEEFFITSEGVLIDHKGIPRPLNPEDTAQFSIDALRQILAGLQVIVNPPQSQEEPSKGRRWWRFFG